MRLFTFLFMAVMAIGLFLTTLEAYLRLALPVVKTIKNDPTMMHGTHLKLFECMNADGADHAACLERYGDKDVPWRTSLVDASRAIAYLSDAHPLIAAVFSLIVFGMLLAVFVIFFAAYSEKTRERIFQFATSPLVVLGTLGTLISLGLLAASGDIRTEFLRAFSDAITTSLIGVMAFYFNLAIAIRERPSTARGERCTVSNRRT